MQKMCLMFLYVCDTGADDEYRLILGFNRDEYWDRPTALADFWGPNGEFISGIDLEPGRGGGTWLGVSKVGKIGALLNMPGALKNKRGRGNLVTDFLEGDLTIDQFITEEIQPIHQEIKNFNLILIDIRSKTTPVMYYTNTTNTPRCLPNGVYSFDNSIMDEPYLKSIHGRSIFTRVIKDYGRKADKDKLVQSIFDILCDTTQFPDDQVLMKRAILYNTPDKIRLSWSAPFIWSPSIRHGTRSNTIVLVDRFGKCDFIERTYDTPVDPGHRRFKTKSFEFKMN